MRIDSCESWRFVRDDIYPTKASCVLREGHLGSHEGIVVNQRWWWNEFGHGLMRTHHPTTGKLLARREDTPQ